MKKKSIYFGIIFFAILIQLSFLPVFFGKSAFGDAVLMLILAISVVESFVSALGWAIVSGILYDFSSYSTLGFHVIIFLMIVYGVSFFSRRLSVEVKGTGVLLSMIFVVFSTLISKGLLVIFFGLEASKSSGSYLRFFGDFRSVFFQILINAILFFLWLGVIKKIRKSLI